MALQALIPIVRTILFFAGTGAVVWGVSDYITELNRANKLRELERAQKALAKLRRRQNGDLVSVYWAHCHEMSPETREMFERELGLR